MAISIDIDIDMVQIRNKIRTNKKYNIFVIIVFAKSNILYWGTFSFVESSP